MKKKMIHYIYSVCILLIITLPLFFMDHEKNKISLLDNSYLPELPDLTGILHAQDEVEEYVNKRIGFRESSVYLYETGVSLLFHKLEHNLYAFGMDGHIMGNMDEYIRDYQHLNLEEDAEFLDAFSGWLYKVNNYMEKENIIFLYFLAPDKKTIYPEGVSDTINVYGEVSRTDLLLQKLDEMQIAYIYPKEEFLAVKEEKQTYNKKYDVLHWNDLGNFMGNQMIDGYFCRQNDAIVPLEEGQFDLRYVCREKLDQSCFYVYEDVPEYRLKDEQGILDISNQDEFGKEHVVSDFEHYINENLPDGSVILILHDSYMVSSGKYYKGRYKEVISVHNSNYWEIQELVEYYKPDIVLFENVERVLALSTFDIDVMNSWNAEYEDEGEPAS